MKYLAPYLLLAACFGLIYACDRAQLSRDPARDARVARDALVTACAFVPANAGREAHDICAAVRGACDGAGGAP